MEIVNGVLLVLHFVGLAGLFGGWFLQLKAIGKHEATIPAGMVHSGWLALATGLLMFGIDEIMFDVSMDMRAKVGVKIVVLAVIMVLLLMNRKKEKAPSPVMWVVGLLVLTNICVAVLWQ